MPVTSLTVLSELTSLSEPVTWEAGLCPGGLCPHTTVNNGTPLAACLSCLSHIYRLLLQIWVTDQFRMKPSDSAADDTDKGEVLYFGRYTKRDFFSHMVKATFPLHGAAPLCQTQLTGGWDYHYCWYACPGGVEVQTGESKGA